MPDVPIPADKLPLVQGDDCAAWILEHCPHSVIGRVDPSAGFVLAFADRAEAEAFRRRWLD
jgi:hypothetical protein